MNMDWLKNVDWQSLAAGAVVCVTALVFLVRMARPRPGSGCSGNCGCNSGRRPPRGSQ